LGNFRLLAIILGVFHGATSGLLTWKRLLALPAERRRDELPSFLLWIVMNVILMDEDYNGMDYSGLRARWPRAATWFLRVRHLLLIQSITALLLRRWRRRRQMPG
jgi:hypothetical protein